MICIFNIHNLDDLFGSSFVDIRIIHETTTYSHNLNYFKFRCRHRSVDYWHIQQLGHFTIYSTMSGIIVDLSLAEVLVYTWNEYNLLYKSQLRYPN